MIANKLHEELNEFFDKLRGDGMTAIALSENEEGRMILLGLLQYATHKEIKLKQLIASLEDTVVISDGSGISREQLANSGNNLTLITINKNDKPSKDLAD